MESLVVVGAKLRFSMVKVPAPAPAPAPVPASAPDPAGHGSLFPNKSEPWRSLLRIRPGGCDHKRRAPVDWPVYTSPVSPHGLSIYILRWPLGHGLMKRKLQLDIDFIQIFIESKEKKVKKLLLHQQGSLKT